MPRPGRNFEKSKDFKGSMVKLFKSLKSWHVVIIIAISLAMISAIMSLIAPNKLSDLTNYVSSGLKPNVDKLKEVSQKVYGNTMQNYYSIYLPSVTPHTDGNVTYMEMPDGLNGNEVDITSLSEDTLDSIVTEVELDGVIITKEDQIKFLEIMSSMKDVSVNEDMLAKLDELPSSIYDLVKPVMDMDSIKKLSLFLAILYVVSALLGYIQQLIMANVTNNYAKGLRSSITKKISTLPLKYFDQHETGDVLSRVTNDVDSMAMNLNQSLATLVTSVTLFVGSIIMMFVTNPIMAITSIVASIIGFGFMFIILGKSQKYFIQRQNQLGDLNGYIEEMYSGHTVIRSYNAVNVTNDEFDKLNNQLFDSSRKSQFLSGIMQPMMGFVGNLGYVAVCVVGALLVLNNKIDFGVIVAFMIYVRMFTNPLSQIAQSMTSMQSTAAAAERVFDFMDEDEMSDQKEIREHLDKSKVKGNIEFKNVKFGYDMGKLIIKDFSAKAKSGQKIAIVGPTGAGKTTMVNLLMKFYEINDGDIFIDGVSTRNLTRENIHDLFCMVLQDTWLFDGTIRDNIKFNNLDVTDEQIWKACHTVGIDHFIRTLPGGLDANVSDNDTISQGQKQLITIARGMIEDAPFLILDEATSNVDTRTEELVQKAMDKLTEGRTSFIIAHRLSTIKNADLILVMKDGNIVEQGNHDDLMKQNGFYANLYNSQFEKAS